MSINIKKDTKDQMAKMVEDAAERLKSQKKENEELAEQLKSQTAKTIALRNKLADTEAALGRANAELAYSVTEKNTLRNYVKKMVDRAAFECGRADYAEARPWRTLWAWFKRKMVRHE